MKSNYIYIYINLVNCIYIYIYIYWGWSESNMDIPMNQPNLPRSRQAAWVAAGMDVIMCAGLFDVFQSENSPLLWPFSIAILVYQRFEIPGWWFGTWSVFLHILGVSSSRSTMCSFFRGVGWTTNQSHDFVSEKKSINVRLDISRMCIFVIYLHMNTCM